MSAPAAKAFGAGDDDAADVLVGLEGVQGDAQLIDEGVVEGVEGLGAVEGDEADLAAGLDDDVLVIHVSSVLV
jgi:hypothetical protein